MIPKILHSCWFGKGSKPELVERCIASWHTYMPNWEYMEWSEDNFDIPSAPLYVRQAYEAKKYAFVSDYVRLWALEQYGGLYMDVDFEVYTSFEPLLDCPEGAFVGREGSKRQPPMLGVMASEQHGKWVTEMKNAYNTRQFKIIDCRLKNGYRYDMTTNVAFFDVMGVHKPEWVHIYPVDYFCPVLTTGERVDSENTFCEHKGLHSWGDTGGWKARMLSLVTPRMKTKLIKIKRTLLG